MDGEATLFGSTASEAGGGNPSVSSIEALTLPFQMAAIEILINALAAFFGFGGLLAWLILLLGWKFFTRPIPVPPGLCEFCGHPIPEVGPVCVECGRPPGQSITPIPRSITIARRVMALALVVIAADVMSFSYRSTTADGQRQLVGNWEAIIVNLVLFTPIPLVALAITYFAMRQWTRASFPSCLFTQGPLSCWSW